MFSLAAELGGSPAPISAAAKGLGQSELSITEEEIGQSTPGRSSAASDEDLGQSELSITEEDIGRSIWELSITEEDIGRSIWELSITEEDIGYSIWERLVTEADSGLPAWEQPLTEEDFGYSALELSKIAEVRDRMRSELTVNETDIGYSDRNQTIPRRILAITS